MKKSMSNKSADSDLGNSQSSTSGTSSPEDTKTTRSKSKQGAADSADFTIPSHLSQDEVARALVLYLAEMRSSDPSLPAQITSGYFLTKVVSAYIFALWPTELHGAVLQTIAEEGAEMLSGLTKRGPLN